MKTYNEVLSEIRSYYDQGIVAINTMHKVDQELSNKLMESLNIIRKVIITYQHKNGR